MILKEDLSYVKLLTNFRKKLILFKISHNFVSFKNFKNALRKERWRIIGKTTPRHSQQLRL